MRELVLNEVFLVSGGKGTGDKGGKGGKAKQPTAEELEIIAQKEAAFRENDGGGAGGGVKPMPCADLTTAYHNQNPDPRDNFGQFTWDTVRDGLGGDAYENWEDATASDYIECLEGALGINPN